MKKNSIYGNLVFAPVLLALAMFAGCTADDDENGGKTDYYMLTPVIATNTGTPVVTRALAGDPDPIVWGLYEELYPMSLENGPKIGVFVLDGNDPASFNSKPAWFQYVLEKDASGNYKRDADGRLIGEWTGLNTHVNNNTEYYIYGFMSANNESWNVTIAPESGSYSNGATMQMLSVKSVTATDVCATVGILKADVSDLTDATLMKNTIINGGKEGQPGLGNFKYKAETRNNFLYLWLDHLYSCINFELQVGTEYSKLRKIKLKQVDFAITNAVPAYNITVNLGSSGTAYASFTPSGTPTASVTDKIYESTAGEEIPVRSADDSPSLSIPGYFAPSGTFSGQQVKVTFTYDVYPINSDKPSRLNAQATNVLNIGDLLTAAGKTLGAGQLFTVKALIEPTYLYVLVDPDLDNPTVIFE
ncbi:MAG: hypothetical protein Q4F34_04830 [Prevotellaceae bacterium]|nr:hypothetical protein [Prevotellaceae bacterium]